MDEKGEHVNPDEPCVEYDKKSHTPLPHFTYILNHFLPIRHCKSDDTDRSERELLSVLQQYYADSTEMKVILTGSSFEGLFIPPYYFFDPKGEAPSVLEASDADVMIEASYKSIGQDDNLGSSKDFHSFLETDSSLVHPGYLRLRLAKPDLTHSDYKVQKPYTQDYYLLSSTITASGTADLIRLLFHRDPQVLRENKFENHGPAFTHFSTKDVVFTPKIDRSRDFDYVLSLPCPEWPKVAAEWVDRERPSGWPDSILISEVLKHGCHAVPVPHHNSTWKQVEWRFSFSVAEKMLVKSLNDIQRHCYKVVKILHKFALGEPKVICSYHLKTILLRLCEKSTSVQWVSENMAACLFYFLDEIARVLSERRLCHYFITDNNLIDHIPEETMLAFTKNFDHVRRDPLMVLFEFSKKYKFGFSPLMLPLETIFKPVTGEIEKLKTKEQLNRLPPVMAECDETLALIHLKEFRYDELTEVWIEIFSLLVLEGAVPKTVPVVDYLFYRALKLSDINQTQNVLECVIGKHDITPNMLSNYACICFGCACEQTSDDVKMTLIGKANSAFEKAVTLVRDRGSTCEPAIWTDYSNFLYNTERYHEAVPYLLDVIKEEESQSVPKGGNCYSMKEVKTVDSYIQAEIGASSGNFTVPSVVFSFYLLINVYHSLSLMTECKEIMERYKTVCEGLANPSAQVFSLLAKSYMNLENYDLAVDMYNKVLLIDPEYATASANLDECEAFKLSLSCLNLD